MSTVLYDRKYHSTHQIHDLRTLPIYHLFPYLWFYRFLVGLPRIYTDRRRDIIQHLGDGVETYVSAYSYRREPIFVVLSIMPYHRPTITRVLIVYIMGSVETYITACWHCLETIQLALSLYAHITCAHEPTRLVLMLMSSAVWQKSN